MKLSKQDKEVVLAKANIEKKINENIATLTWSGGSEIYNIKDMSKIWTDAQQKYLDERFNAIDKRFEVLEKKFDIVIDLLSKNNK